MVLIVGGVYQGKLAYALERFGLSEEDVYFCDDSSTDIPIGKKIVYEIDKWFLALLKANKNVSDALTEFLSDCADYKGNSEDSVCAVICNDISCGVVPIDATIRKWREETGRAMGRLAQGSDEVVRLFCSIPTVLSRTE